MHRHAGRSRISISPRARWAPASTCSSRSRSPPSTEAATSPCSRRRDERGRVLMCGHTFLYSAAGPRGQGACSTRDELGEVFFISSSRVNLGLHQRDISVIWDLGPHDFSILLLLARGAAARVRAVGRDSIVPGIPDVAFITLELPLGDRRQRRAELARAEQAAADGRSSGSEKMVVYDDGAAEPVRHLRPRRRLPRTRRRSASTTSPTARATSSRRSSRPSSRSPTSSTTSSARSASATRSTFRWRSLATSCV